MSTAVTNLVSAVAFAFASLGGAQAAVLDLNSFVGGANVFSFGDFKAPSADVEGAIMAGGNVDLSSYTTNLQNKDAYGHYAMIAGGTLSYNGGNIYNGDIYVGSGAPSMTNGVLSPGYTVSSGAAPANMGQLATRLSTVSSQLTHLAATGTAKEKWGGVFVTGTGTTGVEVIDIDSAWLLDSTYFNLSNVASSATLIVNFIGATPVGFHGDFSAFDVVDNVLFNTTSGNVTINNGFHVSLLAPNADISGGQGEVNGTIIVKSWNSGIQINGTNAFTAAVPGLTVASAVPEADTCAMLLGGLGLVGVIARRRTRASAR